MDTNTTGEPPDFNGQAVAALHHLTGPCRGTMTWLSQPSVNLWVSDGGYVHLYTGETGQSGGTPAARLERPEGGNEDYVIAAFEGRPLWVNAYRVSTRQLKHGDTIEFGDNGPISRYCHYDDHDRVRGKVGDILGDAAAYVRSSRKPIFQRVTGMSTATVHRLVTQTTIPFRIGVILALVFLAGYVYQQNRVNTLLQQQIRISAEELENFSRALARTRDEAIRQPDLDALSRELRGEVATASDRISQIERLSGANQAVIARSFTSIPFLQGAYGFRETSSDRWLRHVVDDNGNPVLRPNGLPNVSLDGQGPIAERQFTGTGFFIDDPAMLVTNRHVGKPWEQDANIDSMAALGLEPQMTRFLAYFPGRPVGVPVELFAASDEADVALLRFTEPIETPVGLTLAAQPPQPGEAVIVMGYPTGLRSMLAQAGEAFVDALRQSDGLDFWHIAQRLAAAERIVPLASGGIVARASEEAIVFDADTTHGGSGGPVFGADGTVIAVTAAILPEYGGSNLGVPIAKVQALLDASAVDAL